MNKNNDENNNCKKKGNKSKPSKWGHKKNNRPYKQNKTEKTHSPTKLSKLKKFRKNKQQRQESKNVLSNHDNNNNNNDNNDNFDQTPILNFRDILLKVNQCDQTSNDLDNQPNDSYQVRLQKLESTTWGLPLPELSYYQKLVPKTSKPTSKTLSSLALLEKEIENEELDNLFKYTVPYEGPYFSYFDEHYNSEVENSLSESDIQTEGHSESEGESVTN